MEPQGQQTRERTDSRVRVHFPRNARWNYVRQLDDDYLRPQVIRIIKRYVANDREVTAEQWGTDKRTLGAVVGDNLNLKVDVQELESTWFVVISVDVR